MPNQEELYSILKVGDFEIVLLKEIPWRIKQLSLPLVKKYLENKVLVICREMRMMEEREFGSRLMLYSGYFKSKEERMTALPYIGLLTLNREVEGFIMVCEDTESNVGVAYPGSYFLELKFTPNYMPSLMRYAKKNYDLRVYLDRKKHKKAKIVNVKLDKKIEEIKNREFSKTKAKSNQYAAIVRSHLDSLSNDDVGEFEKSQQAAIDEEIKNLLKIEQEMGGDFQGKSILQMTETLRQRRNENL